ncbi:MAG: (2Fe-2S)-binding protein [Desulfobulbaceae bacterium]|nr:(2Fe-2S)-binding protein [Desulfobulbaceae bacterium]
MDADERLRAKLRPGCICQGIKLIRILEAIEAGASSFDEIARLTGIGQGPCRGVRCGRKVQELLLASQTGPTKGDEG